jgi:hypothetical protein
LLAIIQSLMATLTITVAEKANQPPNQSGWLSLNLLNLASHTFTKANFTTETNPQYSDPEGDDLAAIKITSLPSLGLLELNGVAVSVDDEITTAELNSFLLVYTSDQSNTDGYSDEIAFKVSDVGSNLFTSTNQPVYIDVAAEVSNQAPSIVGDGEADIFEKETFIFTTASLTTDLDPSYTDPEGDAPLKLLILSVPSFGILTANNNVLESGDEVDWQDIVDGNFKYENTSSSEGSIEGFEFQISDVGSEQYTG